MLCKEGTQISTKVSIYKNLHCSCATSKCSSSWEFFLYKIVLAWKEHNHPGSHGIFYCLIFAMHLGPPYCSVMFTGLFVATNAVLCLIIKNNKAWCKKSFLIIKVTISICVNRKLIRMKPTTNHENNRTSLKITVFLFICSGHSSSGLQQKQQAHVTS